MSTEKTVLVRAFGGRPLIRRVVRINTTAVMVANPDINDGRSVGFPLSDVFEMDQELSDRLGEAHIHGNTRLANIWNEAILFSLADYERGNTS